MLYSLYSKSELIFIKFQHKFPIFIEMKNILYLLFSSVRGMNTYKESMELHNIQFDTIYITMYNNTIINIFMDISNYN